MHQNFSKKSEVVVCRSYLGYSPIYSACSTYNLMHFEGEIFIRYTTKVKIRSSSWHVKTLLSILFESSDLLNPLYHFASECRERFVDIKLLVMGLKNPSQISDHLVGKIHNSHDIRKSDFQKLLGGLLYDGVSFVDLYASIEIMNLQTTYRSNLRNNSYSV